jgi:hypothetical protein
MCEEQVSLVENACTFSGQDFKETLSVRFKERGDVKRKARVGGGWRGDVR